MFGTAWLDVTVAAVFALVGAVSLARLGVCPRGVRGENAWHVVMAAGMVAMALPAVDPLPPWAWAACFAVTAVWAGSVLVRIGPIYGPRGLAAGPVAWRRAAGRAVHQLAASLVMLLMVRHGAPAQAEVPPAAAVGHHAHGVGGSAATAAPLMTIIAIGFLVAAVRGAARLPPAFRASRPVRGVRPVLASPAVAAVCATVMPAGMAAMAATMA